MGLLAIEGGIRLLCEVDGGHGYAEGGSKKARSESSPGKV